MIHAAGSTPEYGQIGAHHLDVVVVSHREIPVQVLRILEGSPRCPAGTPSTTTGESSARKDPGIPGMSPPGRSVPTGERTYECDGCGLTIDRDLNAAVNLARYAQRETDPSTGVVTGGADRKPSPHGDAGGIETRTRAEVGASADDGGSASSKEEAA